jgi:hypothetical protein
LTQPVFSRWYVHRNGETGGPHDAQTIVGWIRGGMRDAVIRPETADPAVAWLPLASDPVFAAALHETAASGATRREPAKTSVRTIVTGVILLVLVAMAVLIWLRAAMGERALETTLAASVRAPIELKNEIVSVPAAHTRGIPFELPYAGELDLQVNVVKGKHVNVYVLDASAWSEFEKAQTAFFGGKFHHYPQFEAVRATTSHTTGRLAQGSYYLALENPTLGILVASSFDVEVKARLQP